MGGPTKTPPKIAPSTPEGNHSDRNAHIRSFVLHQSHGVWDVVFRKR